MNYLNLKVENFNAGQLSEHLANWKCIISDQSILESIAEEKIEFDTFPPLQMVCHKILSLKDTKRRLILKLDHYYRKV